jgi:hypothetical protein
MTRDEILAAFDRIRVWQQGDRRAVHKSLLVLLALGRLLRGEAPLVEFAGIEDQLGKLLKEFGPSGSERTRHNPFWHLRTDGVWQLAGPAEITSRPAGATPTITELRRGRVAGGFAEPDAFASKLAPTVADAFASKLAPTAAAASAGTTCAWAATRSDWKQRTSSGSRRAGRTWFKTASRFVPSTTRSSTSARSPCCRKTTSSCSAATSTLMGGDDTKARLLAHHGAGLIQPQGRECLPHPEFLARHRKEVFKEPARE